ncbi:MAG: hypothetical protein IJU52_09405 [Clostridia bacterium]|nr:hypothetical protein [Clostridia bacterium]
MNEKDFDLSGAFQKLLEDPEALKSVVDVASRLKSSGLFDASGQEKAAGVSYAGTGGAYPDNGTQNDLRLPRAAPERKGAPDDRKQLLKALRPYFSRERQEKLDAILKILDLLEAASVFGALGAGPGP